jgi:hypothetical protein
MFKVGDRVKYITNNPPFTGETGTIVLVNGLEYLRFDRPILGVPQKDYLLLNETHNLAILHTWQVGDEFELDMEYGKVGRGKITALTPFTTVDASGDNWEWTSFELFCQNARPVSVSISYKPGDKIVATREHGADLALFPPIARSGDIGEYVRCAPDPQAEWRHRVKFGDKEYWCGDAYITIYHQPAPLTLSCARCHEPNDYAEPNMPNGSYACYSCRKYHSYACT